MWFPKHVAALHIDHNDHKTSYESVTDYIEFLKLSASDFLSHEDMQKCISSDNIWKIQWYPNTPIGFYIACGSTLENALAKAKEIEDEVQQRGTKDE